ncbi:hypothetical protein BVRB_026210 [Beta vulgaris subsp. vulgaris]|uniref:Nucleolar protein 58/56 N-terminal domain-containing protein n=1 Tax=Beta vulgaris subsp. vulgaris TaxID=3555 RepID=A0A0J8AYU0_BETVV|nr:hypothetical protein BVRB_026210 [Beta vulgaris subsp. vulgaris]
MSLFVLYESAAGLSLFESQARDDIAVKEIQASITDLGRFSTMMTLKAFAPFPSAEVALENMNAITDGILSPFLQSFLEQNVPSVKSKSKLILGVQEARLGGAIQDELKISCECSSRIAELVRGLRLLFLALRQGHGPIRYRPSSAGSGSFVFAFESQVQRQPC